MTDSPAPPQPFSRPDTQTPLRQRASYKLARAGLIVALALGIVMGTVQIIVDYRQEEFILQDTLAKLLLAAKGPADRAVHTLDAEIGAQIVDGIMGYDFIINARIVDENNAILALAKSVGSTARQLESGNRDLVTVWLTEPISKHRIDLNDPLNPNVALGFLEIEVDHAKVLAPFLDRSILVFATGLVRNIILALVMFGVFYWIITRPLAALADSIASIDATHPTPYRPVEPESGDPAEIQVLIAELNSSYAATALYVEERKLHEIELTRHRDRLAELVAERTRELEIAQRKQLHQQRLSTIGLIAGTVAHELRNPLGTILNSFAVLRDKLQTAPGVDMQGMEASLDRIDRSITRCRKIIDELLDFARFREIKPVSIAIDAWLEDFLDGQEFPQEIVLQRKLAAGINLNLDPDRLQQVMSNLVQNAQQCMLQEESCNTGKILTVESAVNGEKLEISVTDTGHGIADDSRAKIFEPLFSTRNFGVGLGLPLVRQIMEQHAGGIELTDSSELGTTFTLWLPISDE